MKQIVKKLFEQIKNAFPKIYFGKFPENAPEKSILLFPYNPNILRCGIVSLLEFKKKSTRKIPKLEKIVQTLQDFKHLNDFLSKKKYLQELEQKTLFQEDSLFCELAKDKKKQQHLERILHKLKDIINNEASSWDANEEKNSILTTLKDIVWRIEKEHFLNIKAIKDLTTGSLIEKGFQEIKSLRRVNSILNIIDRLEIRGRDSAGIAISIELTKKEAERYYKELKKKKMFSSYQERLEYESLVSKSIREREGEKNVVISFVFKVASEIGKLGDNVRDLRNQLKKDKHFQLILSFKNEGINYICHTRWASNGVINIYNCHPLDNATVNAKGTFNKKQGHIFVSLNGDIDNYEQLKEHFEKQKKEYISYKTTTDAKIIALEVEKYYTRGNTLKNAFHKAVSSFEGSHAIAMQSDLEPGKVFLALKGSGQAIYVGIAPDRYVVASEVYGVVEDTHTYITMDGETPRVKGNIETQGQIFILDKEQTGLEGIDAFYYDGTAIKLNKGMLKCAEITTRDIDRQTFSHFFEKEIHQAPHSVLNTIKGKFSLENNAISLSEIIPKKIATRLKNGTIKKIYVIGQGTASIAGYSVANCMLKTFEDKIEIRGIKSSELSGFYLKKEMSNTLIVAITQSGTTTDTNQAVDMVKKRGAYTMAIVNRRNSHITHMVDGVLYTSDGRDIEMSVASTKAFYSQVAAGEILTLAIAKIIGCISQHKLTLRLKSLKKLPEHLTKVLNEKEHIEKIANKWATRYNHWAIVGSGANKIAAEEVRIKLSELCYKSIACDYVEDKKHIDLSSEPLILVCAAGTPPAVLGDVIKDVAIFKAHSSAPIVIIHEGETRFAPYAMDVITVPVADELSSLILNTMAGHLFGYYAAKSINEQSLFFATLRSELVSKISDMTANDLLENFDFQQSLRLFLKEFHRRRRENLFASSISSSTCTDIALLLGHACGQISVQQFENEFGVPGSPKNLVQLLLDTLSQAIDELVRPIDAIKHQAKTVTVGTSRIETDIFQGIVFDTMKEISLIPDNLRIDISYKLKLLQPALSEISGCSYYEIRNLNAMGQPISKSTLKRIKKTGVAQKIQSRSDKKFAPLVGTKREVVQEGAIFVGAGLGDKRNILIIPIFSEQSTITHLLLMHIKFQKKIPMESLKMLLVGNYEHIKNMVCEANIKWKESFLNELEPTFICSKDANTIAKKIIERYKKRLKD